MKLRYTRAVALGASAVLAAGAVSLVGATSATAVINNTVLGPITTSLGSSGTTADLFNFQTTPGCPANDGGAPPTTTNRARVNITSSPAGGPNWTGIALVGNTTAGVSTASNNLAIADSLNGLAAANGVALPLGLYTVTVTCQNSTGSAVSGLFQSQFNFTAGSGGSNTWQIVQSVATTTVVTTSPASPEVDQNVTLTATVTKNAASTSTVAGTVQFKDGAANVGAPQAVNGAGVATLTTNALALGAHSITAEFTADNTANALPADQIAGSTSAAAAVTVGQGATTTSVSVSPSTIYANNPVSLTAVVARATAGLPVPAGTVQFSYSGTPTVGAPIPSTPLGTPVTVTAGAAGFTLGAGLAEGSYTFAAVFTPTNAASYTGSTGSTAPVPVSGIAPTRLATEFIRTTVPAGALTITVQGFVAASPTTESGTPVGSPAYPYGVNGNIDANGRDITTGAVVGASPVATNVVILPQAALNPAGTLIETKGNMIPVVVTDTRAGDLPYSVTGNLTGNFTGAASATNEINAQNLGWTPIFIKSSRFAGQAAGSIAAGSTVTLGTDTNGNNVDLTAGAAVPAANGLAPAAAGNAGLKGNSTLFSLNKGAGTVFYGALLELKAPTTTVPDTYTATLQLTANGTGN